MVMLGHAFSDKEEETTVPDVPQGARAPERKARSREEAR